MKGGRNKRQSQSNRTGHKKPTAFQAKGGHERGGKPTGLKLKSPDNVILYGRNAVEAALKNQNRQNVRLLVTAKSRQSLDQLPATPIPIEQVASPDVMQGHIPEGAPHQGLFLEARPLDNAALEDLTPIAGQKNIILMLDQVTDPQNVGACLRSAAAFGARALVTQDRNSPAENGVLARASAGGLEVMSWVRAANLVQSLETLKDMGYWHLGLDGHTETSIKQADMGDNIVIVMGSEGKGLRPLVRKHCDVIAKIPMTGAVESLNVSNAAAIALYALT